MFYLIYDIGINKSDIVALVLGDGTVRVVCGWEEAWPIPALGSVDSFKRANQ